MPAASSTAAASSAYVFGVAAPSPVLDRPAPRGSNTITRKCRASAGVFAQ
jgi:hypothetical protein